MSTLLSSTRGLFSCAVLLRCALLLYGLLQDAYSPLKFTDVDYFVFTDAARFLSRGQSPYARDTYRYTPLLAWLLYPTAWSGWWFVFGKILFAAGDIVTGWLIMLILRSSRSMSEPQALKLASLWLLNPMVAQISTRGSSEGLMGVLVTALLLAVLEKKFALTGFLLGFAVHFKIYPFIYASSIIWWLDSSRLGSSRLDSSLRKSSPMQKLLSFPNAGRVQVTLWSLFTFASLNLVMYAL